MFFTITVTSLVYHDRSAHIIQIMLSQKNDILPFDAVKSIATVKFI